MKLWMKEIGPEVGVGWRGVASFALLDLPLSRNCLFECNAVN